MEYTIWCDESVSKGKHYSDFYGGVLVSSVHKKEVNERLKGLITSIDMKQEMKWSKVTSNYLEQYIRLMDVFFTLLAEDKAKVRIMFRQSAIEATNISEEQKDSAYHLLYYQFIKHAFGLRYSNPSGEPVYLRTYFDKLPDHHSKNELFKNHIFALQSLNNFEEAKLQIRRSDIVEVDSKRHIELQCLDIVLGAMSFRLNDKHKEKGENGRRGKRTIAKEKLYKYIRSRIMELHPESKNFNIGISTGIRGDITNRWKHAYRHWKFMPKEFRINEDRFK